MSILDEMTEMFSGASGGGASTQILSSLLNQPGGINGILSKLEAAGLGNAVQSWIGRGENRPVDGNQIQNALGGDLISKLASSAGVTNGSAASMIAKFLPLLVDKLTPDGSKPAGGIQSQQIMGALGSLFNMGGSASEKESPYREGLPRA